MKYDVTPRREFADQCWVPKLAVVIHRLERLLNHFSVMGISTPCASTKAAPFRVGNILIHGWASFL